MKSINSILKKVRPIYRESEDVFILSRGRLFVPFMETIKREHKTQSFSSVASSRAEPLIPKSKLSATIEKNITLKARTKGPREALKEAIDQKITLQKKEVVVESSPSHITYTGNIEKPITSTLKIYKANESRPEGIWPVYRIMDESGVFRDARNDGYPMTVEAINEVKHNLDSSDDMIFGSLKEQLMKDHPLHAGEIMRSRLLQMAEKPFPDMTSKEDSEQARNTLLRAYRHMIRLRQMDDILQNAQRQGRISFYMTCHGEEAIHIGCAAALDDSDIVLAQYREAGLLMWRGFNMDQFTNQCFSNDLDVGKGRQMPVHYGSKALDFHTISSPLGTQLPQAVGVAYKLKLDGKKDSQEKKRVAIAFFGDGSASTTDFHSACNFAATLKVPMIFFCRNNGYAISTPITDQYAGDGIVSRAPGYGMAGIRIDGNDIFAVHAAVQAARKYAIDNSAPILIEAMSYRQGHHSTSDDSTRYRSADEVRHQTQISDPIDRLGSFLKRNNILSASGQRQVSDEERMAVLKSIEQAERRPPPRLEMLFEDVYSEMTVSLLEQERDLKHHIAKYPNTY